MLGASCLSGKEELPSGAGWVRVSGRGPCYTPSMAPTHSSHLDRYHHLSLSVASVLCVQRCS